jgi:predicted signal transduction protein with EAL and GGDEF domain
MTTASRSLTTALSRARSLAACSAELHHQPGRDRTVRHLPTTAEGVETSEQLSLLRSEGCDEVQGYLFSPALSAADAEKMIAKRRLRVVA